MTAHDKQQLKVHIRWMIRRDMPEVLDVENDGFEFPWSEDDFIRCLRSATASAWWPSMTSACWAS